MDETTAVSLLKRLYPKPPGSKKEREHIYLLLKDLIVQKLRTGQALPPELAYFLAMALEDIDTGFLLAKRKDPIGDSRTKATPDVAFVYQHYVKMPRKERKDETKQGSALAATAAFFGIDEDTVKKANSKYDAWARSAFDSAAEGVDPRLLRREAYYRVEGRYPFMADIHTVTEFPDGELGYFLKTGDFEIFDREGNTVFCSYKKKKVASKT